jgi:hypothetical protein
MAGDRVAPTITDALAERLAAHIDERGLVLTDWLFADPHGGPMSPDNWRARVWRPAVERAGLAGPKPASLRLLGSGAHVRPADGRLVAAWAARLL